MKTLLCIKERIQFWENLSISGYVIRTLGVFELLKNSAKEKVIDYNLNIMNNEAVYHWLEYGATRVTTSAELAKEELEQLNGPLETIIYGKLPVMTTEQCVLGNHKLCHKKKPTLEYSLSDRKGAKWPILTDCIACKMQILMHEPLLIEEKYLEDAAIMVYRILFTDEKAEQVKEILSYLIRQEPTGVTGQKASFFKPID